MRLYEDVDMIRHHDVRVQIVVVLSLGAESYRLHNHPRDFVSLEPGRVVTGFIQIPIHPHEGLTRSQTIGWRVAILREATLDLPRDKNRFARWLPMRETAAIVHVGE
jgi:hypothetical protein